MHLQKSAKIQSEIMHMFVFDLQPIQSDDILSFQKFCVYILNLIVLERTLCESTLSSECHLSQWPWIKMCKFCSAIFLVYNGYFLVPLKEWDYNGIHVIFENFCQIWNVMFNWESFLSNTILVDQIKGYKYSKWNWHILILVEVFVIHQWTSPLLMWRLPWDTQIIWY